MACVGEKRTTVAKVMTVAEAWAPIDFEEHKQERNEVSERR